MIKLGTVTSRIIYHKKTEYASKKKIPDPRRMKLYQAIYDVAKDFYPTAEEVNHFEIKSIASQIMERPEIWLTYVCHFYEQEKYIQYTI